MAGKYTHRNRATMETYTRRRGGRRAEEKGELNYAITREAEDASEKQ